MKTHSRPPAVIAEQSAFPGTPLAFSGAATSVLLGSGAILQSTVSVVVSAAGNNDPGCGASHDARAVPPAFQELVGVASRRAHLHAAEEDTVVAIYSMAGLEAEVSLTPGTNFVTTGLQRPPLDEFQPLLAYDRSPLRLVANKPIGAIAMDDGDGCAATSFLPPFLMNR